MKQKYKVFLNDRVIKIGRPENITKNKFTTEFNVDVTPEDIKMWFHNFEKSNIREASLIHPHPELFFMKFQSAFRIIHAAGGVVVHKNKMLFIFRNGKWDLPKGKLDPKELAEDAAVREVIEETGISPEKITSRLPATFHLYESPYEKTKGQWIFKNTYWFQMTCKGTPSGKPQEEEGITEVKWIPRTELDEVLANTYENLKQIISLYRA